MNYTVKITRSLIENIGKVEIDNISLNPLFVLGEETKEWLNINTIGEWRVVNALDTRIPSQILFPQICDPQGPSIVFSCMEDYTYFLLRWA